MRDRAEDPTVGVGVGVGVGTVVHQELAAPHTPQGGFFVSPFECEVAGERAPLTQIGIQQADQIRPAFSSLRSGL